MKGRVVKVSIFRKDVEEEEEEEEEVNFILKTGWPIQL